MRMRHTREFMSSLNSLLSMSPLKISVGYMLFGLLWVPGTEIAMAAVFPSQGMPTPVGLLAGWTFIVLSTVLIYTLSSVHRNQMSTAQRKLQTANEQLQVLHRVFRHNIRNDINVIHGYAEILCENLEKTNAQMHAETVRETAEQITTISEKLKMIENVDPTIADEDVVDLVAIVESELERIQTVATDVVVRSDLPTRAWVEGDDSIEYAIREVLENAVVHNDKSTCELEIRLERTDGEVQLLVDDNGPGIPGDELRSLQSGEETALVHASSVGLWLVRWMCQLHDGYVKFSTASTRGTTVSFHFQSGSQASLAETGASVNDRFVTAAN